MTVHVTRWKTGDLSSLTAEIGPMKRTQLQEMNQGITQKLLICSGQTSILVKNWGIQRWTVSRAPEQYWKVSHWDSVRFMNVWPHSVSTWFGCEVFFFEKWNLGCNFYGWRCWFLFFSYRGCYKHNFIFCSIRSQAAVRQDCELIHWIHYQLCTVQHFHMRKFPTACKIREKRKNTDRRQTV